MDEKVIHGVRFIRTDNGFRIEIEGDKQYTCEMDFGSHRHGRHGSWSFGSGPESFERFFDFDSWCWDDETEDDDEVFA